MRLQFVNTGRTISVRILRRWRVDQGESCIARIARNQSVIVTIELGEGFLKDHAPDRVVFGSVREQCQILRLAVGIDVLLKWKVVVDEDCMGHAERVELDAIDTMLVQIVSSVDEDFL